MYEKKLKNSQKSPAQGVHLLHNSPALKGLMCHIIPYNDDFDGLNPFGFFPSLFSWLRSHLIGGKDRNRSAEMYGMFYNKLCGIPCKANIAED